MFKRLRKQEDRLVSFNAALVTIHLIAGLWSFGSSLTVAFVFLFTTNPSTVPAVIVVILAVLMGIVFYIGTVEQVVKASVVMARMIEPFNQPRDKDGRYIKVNRGKQPAVYLAVEENPNSPGVG